VAATRPRTCVYVDGFNFYYGAVRDTPYQWCDLSRLFELLLPGHNIVKIRYFTALTKPRASDPHIHVRQGTYLRALRTLPNLSVHLGTFRESIKRLKSVDGGPGSPNTVRVLVSEEKGSDVNLASYLLLDAFRGEFEHAAVVSNDTDLLTPIEMVIREMGLPVVLINPHPQPARDLLRVASHYLRIREGVLRVSQFPSTLTDERGTFHKPSTW
jgi:uncharacterized LabA/DUF88 family protein